MPETRTGKVVACLLLLSAAMLPAPPASASTTAVACGDVLTTDTTLTTDLTCTGDALTIGADDVDLDLGGHTVTGSGTGRGLTLFSRTGATVHDGTIGGFRYAIYSDFAVGVSHTDLTVTGVRLLAPVDAWQSKITFRGTHDTCRVSGLRLVDGTIVIDRCSVAGQIVMVRAAGPVVRDSLLTGGSLHVSASGQGTFTRNVFDAFPMGLATDTRSSVVRANVFKNAPGAAFGAGETFLPEDANTVEYNLFTGNDIGLRSDHLAFNVIIRRNVFSGNDTAGILMENRFGPNKAGPHPISGNVFVGNGHHPSGVVDRQGNVVQGGIHLASGVPVDPRAKLENNVGTGNAGYLIWAAPGTVTDGGGNQGPCAPNPDLTCW